MDVVVVLTPGCEAAVGTVKAVEDLLVQELVALPADVTLNEGALLRLAGADAVRSHTALPRRVWHRLGNQLGRVVADDKPWCTTPADRSIELAGQPCSRDRGVWYCDQAFQGEVGDDHHDTESATLIEAVRGEVQGPAIAACATAIATVVVLTSALGLGSWFWP